MCHQHQVTSSLFDKHYVPNSYLQKIMKNMLYVQLMFTYTRTHLLTHWGSDQRWSPLTSRLKISCMSHAYSRQLPCMSTVTWVLHVCEMHVSCTMHVNSEGYMHVSCMWQCHECCMHVTCIRHAMHAESHNEQCHSGHNEVSVSVCPQPWVCILRHSITQHVFWI